MTTPFMLVPMGEEHVAHRVAWLNDPAVRAGLPIEGPVTEKSTRQWLERVAQADDRQDLVLLGERGEPLAMAGLTGIVRAAGRAELYLFVAPELLGRGVGGDALRAVCNHGFDALQLRRIFLWTVGPNTRARRLYEAHGFTSEGVLRAHTMWHGTMVDRHVFGMLRAEWQCLPWSSPRWTTTGLTSGARSA